MHKVKQIILAVLILGAMAITGAAQNSMSAVQEEKSLYDRLGGIDAIKAVVGEFAGRVLADPRVNKKFAKSDAPRLVLHLEEIVCKVTGGPCEYSGLSMKDSHQNMKVTDGEFKALVEDLVGALDKFNVAEKEKSDLLKLLGPLHDQIVEVKSDATGTPLPKDFKPAPALPKPQVDAGPAMKTP
jgi:hemoglobin